MTFADCRLQMSYTATVLSKAFFKLNIMGSSCIVNHKNQNRPLSVTYIKDSWGYIRTTCTNTLNYRNVNQSNKGAQSMYMFNVIKDVNIVGHVHVVG